MPEFVVSQQLEAESIRDLRSLLDTAKIHGIALALIGGYAARAYTKPAHYRGTKDIDFIASKSNVGPIKGMLKELGYEVRDTRHGLKAIRTVEHGDIKLDIAIDSVLDDSTGKTYELRPESITGAKPQAITAFYEENQGLHTTALVAPIEDVLVMKLLTDEAQRPRDKFDVVAMLFDSHDQLAPKALAEACQHSDLAQFIRTRLETLLVQAKQGKLRKPWQEYSGLALTRAQENEIKQRASELIAAL